MNALMEWLSKLFTSWKFWIVIRPWDIGVRVRLGATATALSPGLHARIPLIDEITIVNTRLRIEQTPTITTAGSVPGSARVMSATIGYCILDPVKAMLKYTNPGSAIQGLAQAEMLAGSSSTECMDTLNGKVTGHGLEIDFVHYSENVQVKTYRILSASGGLYQGFGYDETSPRY